MNLKSFIETPDDMRTLIKNALVIDLETTLNGDTSFKADPHNAANRIVAAAISAGALQDEMPSDEFTLPLLPWPMPDNSGVDRKHIVFYENGSKLNNDELFNMDQLHDVLNRLFTETVTPKMLVGHNIIFDLQYLWREDKFNSFPWHDVVIWDTMLAQYYLSGQEDSMISLEKACEKNEIPFVKDDEVKMQFKLGMGADKINPVVLLDYLSLDIKSTNMLFRAQHNAIHKNAGVLGLRYVIGMMTAAVTTGKAQSLGMCLDLEKLQRDRLALQMQYNDEFNEIRDTMAKIANPEINRNTLLPTSASQIKKLLYGGTFPVADTEVLTDVNGDPVRYKTGQRKGEVKTRKTTKLVTQDPSQYIQILYRHYAASDLPPKDTSTKSLKDLVHLASSLVTASKDPVQKMLVQLIHFRQIQKELTTSYEGLLKHARHYPDGSYLHPSYNHAITRTKRLSSSNPNMQNVSNKETQEGGPNV